MTTKHTPAPWSVKGREGERNIEDARGDYVCGLYTPDLAEQEANARLIVAAPDMFTAGEMMARALRDLAKRYGMDAGEVYGLSEWADAAAKARGED